ncbi:MAG: hypothetical protein IKM54_05520, partial [Butyricicoccus sp.]|nr:hypothetical protein [Butyricicoccus sp.]
CRQREPTGARFLMYRKTLTALTALTLLSVNIYLYIIIIYNDIRVMRVMTAFYTQSTLLARHKASTVHFFAFYGLPSAKQCVKISFRLQNTLTKKVRTAGNAKERGFTG